MSKRYKSKRRERYYRRPRPSFIYVDEIEDVGPCWCGETDPYFAPIERTCGGSGFINCICGGDLCVCHWHGEVECCGCEDCEHDEGFPSEDEDYYETQRD